MESVGPTVKKRWKGFKFHISMDFSDGGEGDWGGGEGGWAAQSLNLYFLRLLQPVSSPAFVLLQPTFIFGKINQNKWQ